MICAVCAKAIAFKLLKFFSYSEIVVGRRFLLVVVHPALNMLLFLLFLGHAVADSNISGSLLNSTVVKELLSAHVLSLQCPQFHCVLGVLL